MRTSKEERADLRARCKAGVIAITTDAALVAALLDDVEELDAEVDRLRGERDARPEITAMDALCGLVDAPSALRDADPGAYMRVYQALRAHAGKVAR